MAEIVFTIDNNALEQVRNIDLKGNFSEVKTALAEMVTPYQNLIVTEDAIPQAKSDRARLRKIATSIDDQRKMIKRVYTEPVKVFEEKCKELTDILTSAATNIDRQVKAFEEQKRDLKMMDLRTFFEDHEKKHPEYVTWSQIVDERWGNATYDEEVAKFAIEQAIKDSDTAVDTLLEMHSEYEVAILNEYKNSHNIYKALGLNAQLVETAARRKEQEERLAKQREEQRAREAELSRKAAEVKAQVEAEMKEDPESFSDEPIIVKKTFQITATKEAMQALEEFMRQHFISYKEI